jgi:hypothetical protein
MLPILAVMILVSMGVANATVELQLTSGATVITVTDGLAGDANPAANVVTFIGAVGSWNLNITTGFGEGTFPGAIMDLGSANTSLGGAGLDINLSQNNLMTDYTGGVSGRIDGNGTGGFGTATYSAYFNGNNALHDITGTLIGTTGPLVSPTNANFSGPGPGAVTPYSLTMVIQLTSPTAGGWSGDANLTPVPEPASFAMLGSVLLLACAALKRKFRRS